MGLACGPLKHWVTLQEKITAQNTYGEQETNWETVAQFWASVAPLSARELMLSQQIQSDVSARIVMRYRSDITAAMRILHNGKVYNIRGVQADPESGLEYLTLPVSLGLNDG